MILILWILAEEKFWKAHISNSCEKKMKMRDFDNENMILNDQYELSWWKDHHDRDGGCINHASCTIFSHINQCSLVCCAVCMHLKSVQADDDNAMDQLENFIPTFQIHIILVLFNVSHLLVVVLQIQMWRSWPAKFCSKLNLAKGILLWANVNFTCYKKLIDTTQQIEFL